MSKIVKFEGVGSIENVTEMLKKEFFALNNGYEVEDIISYIKENGSGVYELMFGCRGGMEGIEKNNVYFELEDLYQNILKDYGGDEQKLISYNGVESKEEFVEYLEEFYNDEDNYLNESYTFTKTVGYFEESWSLFINVVV